MNKLVYLFYKFLLMPLFYLLLQIIRPFSKGKLRELLDDKNQNFANCNDANISAKHPIWIHAASGEIEYARPLIRELKSQFPHIPILVTYSSPSAKSILADLDIDAWAALPWDFGFCFNRFIKRWNPRALLVSRTDLWPAMASVAKNRNLPAFLFSATFADNSSRLRGLTRYLTAYSLEKLNEIFCVSVEDSANLKSLALSVPISVIGDTRFDQALYRLNHPKEIKLSLRPNGFVLVMGSTWPEDEAALLPAMCELKKSGVRFILAPHETTTAHLEQLQQQLSESNLSYCLYNHSERWVDEDVLLIDQVGILAEIYSWGSFAFVGGSFRRQVHSVMEPLAAGLAVLVGPFHHNNREALEYQHKNVLAVQMVTSVRDSADIVKNVHAVQKISVGELHQAILLEVYKNQGSTQKLLSALSSKISFK